MKTFHELVRDAIALVNSASRVEHFIPTKHMYWDATMFNLNAHEQYHSYQEYRQENPEWL